MRVVAMLMEVVIGDYCDYSDIDNSKHLFQGRVAKCSLELNTKPTPTPLWPAAVERNDFKNSNCASDNPIWWVYCSATPKVQTFYLRFPPRFVRRRRGEVRNCLKKGWYHVSVEKSDNCVIWKVSKYERIDLVIEGMFGERIEDIAENLGDLWEGF